MTEEEEQLRIKAEEVFWQTHHRFGRLGDIALKKLAFVDGYLLLTAELTKAKEENEALRKLLDKMANALGALQDCQNGPPLVTYEKDWNAAMKLTGTVLTEYDSLKQDSHAINTEPVVADRAQEK